VPYLTPQELPESDKCRSLLIPADSEWLALFGGALTELTKSYNWEDSGGLSIQDTVDLMTEIVNNWYESICAACETPGGYRVIRINSTGHIEQLDENGDWVPATDDYYIPPPEAREGGTIDDQICLAAKNAVNVLHTLYESLADSWNGDLDDAEAVLALIGVEAGILGFAIAPIVWGIYAFFLPIFAILFAGLEYLIADLWDEDFTDQITCFLVDCATDTDGVVTFDWECFMDKLNSLTNTFDLTETQLRLYLQIAYLLNVIGGVDALNLAGRTTAITDDDCPCECVPELEIFNSWGTLTYLGDSRWFAESSLEEGVHRLAIRLVTYPDECWRYVDSDFTGTETYSEHTDCGDCGDIFTGFPADGTNICTIYLANETPVGFSWEFTALCEG